MNKSNTLFITGLVLLALIFIYYLNTSSEGFKSSPVVSNITGTQDTIEEIIGVDSTVPTAINPFMNVLIDEIKTNPKRGPAVSIQDPLIQVQLDDFFRTQFINDPTDVFGKSQSQRQFITMPSTTIPNDQESYQNWLYKIPGKTCKEGGREACMPGTDGGALPWLNVNP
jgi:hypothetical protein